MSAPTFEQWGSDTEHGGRHDARRVRWGRFQFVWHRFRQRPDEPSHGG